MDHYIITQDGEKFSIKKNLKDWAVAADQTAAEQIILLLVNSTEKGPAIDIDDAIGSSELSVCYDAQRGTIKFAK